VLCLCLSVFAINGLYTALGSPSVPGWITNGGDPCNEGWQGVECVVSNITSMYDLLLHFRFVNVVCLITCLSGYLNNVIFLVELSMLQIWADNWVTHWGISHR
jgi:hypothetical protein